MNNARSLDLRDGYQNKDVTDRSEIINEMKGLDIEKIQRYVIDPSIVDNDPWWELSKIGEYHESGFLEIKEERAIKAFNRIKEKYLEKGCTNEMKEICEDIGFSFARKDGGSQENYHMEVDLPSEQSPYDRVKDKLIGKIDKQR